jgi:hypothetical protein
MCDNCGGRVISLDELMDNEDCGCDSFVCLSCGEDWAPVVDVVEHSGALIVSDTVDGYWVTRTFYGYTRGEAVRLFVEDVAANV